MYSDALRQVYWLCFVIYPAVVSIQSLILILLVWTFKRELVCRWLGRRKARTLLHSTFSAPVGARKASGGPEVTYSACREDITAHTTNMADCPPLFSSLLAVAICPAATREEAT
jgi:hypothetical protein